MSPSPGTLQLDRFSVVQSPAQIVQQKVLKLFCFSDLWSRLFTGQSLGAAVFEEWFEVTSSRVLDV